MINIIIVFIGIILMIYAAWECVRLRQITSQINTSAPMNFILSLICLFLLGYIGYFGYLINQSKYQTIDFLVSLILFFGSIFVVVVKRVNYNLIQSLDLKNKEIIKSNLLLAAKQKELEKIQLQIEAKNVKLGQALDDVYTLQLNRDENSEKN